MIYFKSIKKKIYAKIMLFLYLIVFIKCHKKDLNDNMHYDDKYYFNVTSNVLPKKNTIIRNYDILNDTNYLKINGSLIHKKNLPINISKSNWIVLENKILDKIGEIYNKCINKLIETSDDGIKINKCNLRLSYILDDISHIKPKHDRDIDNIICIFNFLNDFQNLKDKDYIFKPSTNESNKFQTDNSNEYFIDADILSTNISDDIEDRKSNNLSYSQNSKIDEQFNVNDIENHSEFHTKINNLKKIDDDYLEYINKSTEDPLLVFYNNNNSESSLNSKLINVNNTPETPIYNNSLNINENEDKSSNESVDDLLKNESSLIKKDLTIENTKIEDNQNNDINYKTLN